MNENKEIKESFIEKIKIKNVRNIIKNFEIPLDKNSRKHLIITGKNGSGKTSTLLEINSLFNKFINNENKIIEVNKKNDINKAQTLQFNDSIKRYNENIIQSEKAIDDFSMVDLNFTNKEFTFENITNHKFLLAYFSTTRHSKPIKSQGVTKQNLNKNLMTSPALNKEFIQYMVNLHTEKVYAKEDGDSQTVIKIEKWFNNFENSLKKLFNEQSLKFIFMRKEFDFKIEFDGRSFGLDQLSDGYSSIISILTELILRMKIHNVDAYDMQGVVLIDEMETHLHVELQKQILPFLTSFFPKIQFIVTTHSPFILSSLPDAVICDLEKRIIHTDKISNIENYFLNDIISEFFDVDLNDDKIKNPNKEKQKKAKSMLLDLIKTVKEEG